MSEVDDLVKKIAGMKGPCNPLAPELPFDEIWTPEPDTNLIIPALGIAPGPAHLVTGSWYTGKTLLLATMGLAVAAGSDLFNLYRTQRGKWIHFDHEMGRRHLKRYVQRLRAGLGTDPEELRGHVSLRVLPQLNLRSDKAVDHYTDLLAGYSIATIDPLRAAAPGANENESEFRQYIDILGIVSDRTGCAIVLLHHGGKPVEGSQRKNVGRGTSAIDDAVQSKFVLTAEEKGAPMLVSHEKTRELTKPLDDFYLEIENGPDFVRLAHRNAEEMQEAVESARAQKDRIRIEKAKLAVRTALGKYAGTFRGARNDFVGLVGGDRSVVQKTISEMVAVGELRSEGKGEARVWSAV